MLEEGGFVRLRYEESLAMVCKSGDGGGGGVLGAVDDERFLLGEDVVVDGGRFGGGVRLAGGFGKRRKNGLE